MFSKCARLVSREIPIRHARFLLTSAGENSTLTIKETREKLKDLVGAQRIWGSAGSIDKKEKGPIATSQDELPVRRMRDSYREAIIPVGSDPMVREKYINLYNGIRFGRILEDLDTFAVAIGYTHTLNPASETKISPISIVTALVDRISLLDGIISPTHDIKMTGKVTWAGTTSMEITMELDQEENNILRKCLTAKFVMVARNPTTKGIGDLKTASPLYSCTIQILVEGALETPISAVINKLQPDGPEEQKLFEAGEESKAKRLLEGQRTLLKIPPSEDERLLIHQLFLQTIDPKANTFKLRVKPDNSVWMEDTILKNLVVCMPEQRNMYNKIFGGFLMRKAFELAWANAALFCKTRPYVEIVDDIAFRKPVEVGSILFLSSQVVYVVGTKLQVKVHAEVVNPKDGTRETTNDFHFTFNTRTDEVKTVIPKTYAEAMLYLDGKRHFDS